MSEIKNLGSLKSTLDGTENVPIQEAAGGAGSSKHTTVSNVRAGVPIVRKFAIAYNTANILTGHTFYTPTVGDVLLDAWIEVDTPWDGTFPKGDIGFFAMAGPPTGLFELAAAGNGNENDMTNPDVTNGGLLVDTSDATSLSGLQSQTTGAHRRIVPGKFVTADPLQVIVTGDGTPSGGDPGSTQGAGFIYLITASPV